MGLYQSPVSEVIDIVIEIIWKEGDGGDKKVGDVIFRNPNIKKNMNENPLGVERILSQFARYGRLVFYPGT